MAFVVDLRDGRGFFMTLLSLIQVALAVVIAIVVRRELWSWTGGWRWSARWWAHTGADNVCLMTTGGANLCAFTYVVVAVSLAASATLLLLQCFSRRPGGCCACCGRCCATLEGWVALLLGAWWAAAATTATVYGVRADNAQPPVPQHGSRTAVWAMAWSEAGLWWLTALLALCTRGAARRRTSEAELSASLQDGAGRYQRYNDTPFNSRSSKWREARDAFAATRSSTAALKVLDP